LPLNSGQDSGAAFKTPLTAEIEHNGVTSAPLPVIFPVVTSPDTPKANYWGHMAPVVGLRRVRTGDHGKDDWQWRARYAVVLYRRRQRRFKARAAVLA
ncbi:hypothetical protein SE13_22740, partial [Salmonella enterica subsp. enterica serovar Thompson]